MTSREAYPAMIFRIFFECATATLVKVALFSVKSVLNCASFMTARVYRLIRLFLIRPIVLQSNNRLFIKVTLMLDASKIPGPTGVITER